MASSKGVTSKEDTNSKKNTSQDNVDESKRDFMVATASGVAAIGGAAAIAPMVGSMSPAADVLALSSIEVDVSALAAGDSMKAMWQGKPVFIRRRTADEIATAISEDKGALPDPQNDADRVQKGHEDLLVVVGVCTHLGCIPLNKKGDFGGWFCPCHGSHYDVSGRIRKGPAPRNLDVPKYEFISDNVVKIG